MVDKQFEKVSPELGMKCQNTPNIHAANKCQTFVIVIVISKLLKRHSKAKRRAPAYSRALRLVRRVVRESSPKEVRVRFPVVSDGSE